MGSKNKWGKSSLELEIVVVISNWGLLIFEGTFLNGRRPQTILKLFYLNKFTFNVRLSVLAG